MLQFESRTRFWIFVFIFFAVVLWILRPVLLPFLAGMAIAYFLNPAVDKLCELELPVIHRHIPRWLGAFCVLFGFGLIAALILMLLVPMLQAQIGALLNSVPSYIEKLREHYIPGVETWLARFEPDDVEKFRDAAGQSFGEAAGWMGQLFKHILTSGVALIDIVALCIVTPVVAFFMLRDWSKLTSTIDSVFPRTHYAIIKAQLRQIDLTLSGFVRGQALVCLSLGAIYSIGLSLAGLKYGATVGIIAGVFSFIPYVGTGFGWVTSVILALVQFDNDWPRIGVVVAVFAVGHFLEAYVLTPKLVGNRVGLHPLWILFALITGAKLMGFTGILIAVPTAAVIGVLTRFAIAQYKDSGYYKNPSKPRAPHA
jgi:predicted PurR-regulated permease PerM